MKSNSILLVAAVVLSLPLAAQAQLPSPYETGAVAPLGTVPDVAWDAAPVSFADPNCVDGVACAGMVDPSCTDGASGDPRCRRCWDLWGSAEVLLWWMKGTDLPPIVGTSPAGTPRTDASVFGTPGYQTIFGDDIVGRDLQPGGRITLGTWLDATHNAGIGARFYALDGSVERFDAVTDGSTIIGRPFFNVGLNEEDSALIGFPGEVAGNVHAKFTNSLIGTDAYLRVMIERSRLRRLDVVSGYQFLRMDDDLRIDSTSDIIDPTSLIFGARINVFDRFRATNEFHGAMVGLQGTMGRGNWSLTGLGKLGIGNNHQQVIIEGRQGVSFPPGPVTPIPGGLFAQPSNIGTFTRDRICYIPELTLNLAYHIRPTVSVHVGYNMIWMSNVVVSGEQIDRRVNLSQVPGPVVGPNLPALAFRSTEYWVQGINLGVNWNF
ncbi:MAG: BBP7 family outer membrane beta-barrel protein [Pirellulaceae bacterium]